MPSVSECIIRHAEKVFPKEACGYVTLSDRGFTAVACENISVCPENSYRLDPASYAGELDNIVAFYHSHPNGSALPSEGDKRACNLVGKPFLIAATTTNALCRLAPSRNVSTLLTRPFSYGLYDGLTLVEDFMWSYKGVRLPPVEHPSYQTFSDKRGDLEGRMRKLGFVPVATPVSGDVLLFRVDGSVSAGHVAVLVNDEFIVEQRAGQVSCCRPMTRMDHEDLLGTMRHAG